MQTKTAYGLVAISLVLLTVAQLMVPEEPAMFVSPPALSLTDLPTEVAEWQTQFVSHVLGEISGLSPEALAEVYAQADRAKVPGGDNRPDLPTIQGWLRQYFERDFAAFCLAMLNECQTLQQRRILMTNMRGKEAPTVQLEFNPSTKARVQPGRLLLSVNPANLQSVYEEYRETLCHEMLHYVAQGGVSNPFNGLHEGMTEYLTARVHEVLGWPYDCDSYEDVVLGLAVMVPLLDGSLMDYYVQPNSFGEAQGFSHHVARVLEQAGVAPEQSCKLAEDWLMSDSALDGGLTNAFFDHELSMLDIQYKLRILKFTEEHYFRFASWLHSRNWIIPTEAGMRTEAEELLAGNSVLAISLYYEGYESEVLPVLRHLCFQAPLPSELTDLQRRLLKAAEAEVDLQKRLRPVAVIYFDGAYEALREVVDQAEADLAKAEKKRLHRRLLSALAEAGYDIVPAMAEANVPLSLRVHISGTLAKEDR